MISQLRFKRLSLLSQLYHDDAPAAGREAPVDPPRTRAVTSGRRGLVVVCEGRALDDEAAVDPVVAEAEAAERERGVGVNGQGGGDAGSGFATVDDDLSVGNSSDESRRRGSRATSEVRRVARALHRAPVLPADLVEGVGDLSQRT